MASGLAIGFCANIARYRRAVREIDKARTLQRKPDMHLAVIRSAGAVSLGSVILLNAIAVALRVLEIASS